MKNQTNWERQDEESCFWIENRPQKPVWSPEKGNCPAFHGLPVLTESGLGVLFVFFKTYLTVPSVFHHNRNSPQSPSLAVWITRVKGNKGYWMVTAPGETPRDVWFCHFSLCQVQIAPGLHLTPRMGTKAGLCAEATRGTGVGCSGMGCWQPPPRPHADFKCTLTEYS